MSARVQMVEKRVKHLLFLEVANKHEISQLQDALRQAREDILDGFKELLQLTEDPELPVERRLAMVNSAMRQAIEAGSAT